MTFDSRMVERWMTVCGIAVRRTVAQRKNLFFLILVPPILVQVQSECQRRQAYNCISIDVTVIYHHLFLL
jgi:hypothetical protein